jgi:hypothetical protein
MDMLPDPFWDKGLHYAMDVYRAFDGLAKQKKKIN